MVEERHLRAAALDTCETLLAPGGKWHLSPYLLAALHAVGEPALATYVPVYQSVVIDLLRAGRFPEPATLLDIDSPQAIGTLAILDALLALKTACALYNVPDGLDDVQLHCSSEDSGARLLRDVFADVLGSRAAAYPDFDASAIIGEWAVQLALGSSPMPEAPNVIFFPFPWREPRRVSDLLHGAPAGTILAGLAWSEREARPSDLFAWRYELLKEQDDLVALGPCGQEYGRQLPQACCDCEHGRREPIHLSGSQPIPATWSYALISKRTEVVEQPAFSLVSRDELQKAVCDDLHLRYVGVYRQRLQPVEHPDSFNDDPSDEKWEEYLKVCPGHTPASKLAIQRRAGMQTPRLRYGQWLHLDALEPQQPYSSRPDIYTFGVRNETSLHAIVGGPNPVRGLPAYTDVTRSAVDEVAHRLFGFEALWPFQHRILERVLCGGDIFAIAATGGGKSECYILPSLLLPGVTVVVSPLKSLMQDQYEQRITERYGIDHLATFINGDVRFYERQGRLRRVILGHFKLIYVTPEQLERGYVLEALGQAEGTVGFRRLALDEAHCISQWGHDFRPSYLNILQRLGQYNLRPQRVALTATASPLVRDDVCAELHLDARPLNEGGDVYIDAANRPELNLVVRRVGTTEEKAREIVDALRRLEGDGSAIVFMPHTGGTLERPYQMGAPATNPRLENVGMVSTGVTPFAHYLSMQLGEDVAMYHGKMEDGPLEGDDESDEGEVRTRREEQRRFMSGEKRVMVATKGFGMGVDKPDIRLVIHRSPPGNLEAYAQEAGRAGRDGKLATILLFYSEDRPRIVPVRQGDSLGREQLQSDREIQEFFIESRYVRRQDVESMIAFLRSPGVRRVNDGLYFTNDQVMAFFERCRWESYRLGLSQPYAWPEFEERRVYSYESYEHKVILDRGYEYKKKREHIGRILSVLFNTRPTLNRRVIPLIKGVYEAGTKLREFRLYQPERIVGSPAYFGGRLRSQKVTTQELRELLPNGKRVDITPLASRLGLALRETVSMLADIRSCEGRTQPNGYWIGTLLNFWWVEAPRLVNLPDPYDTASWRNHAGARRREWATGSKTLEDYFPDKVLCHPQGWEVIPDAGLNYPDQQTYLERFMALHDARRRNDEDNFAYLVDRYIGGDGGPKECLRSLLMGYLKTNEVVVGGNCHSCSVCVPDLHFERFPVEERLAAVARLLPGTLELISQVERTSRTALKSVIVERLLDSISEENAMGRSGSAYLDSWLTRLLQDDPQHRGALWVRFAAFRQAVLDLKPRMVVDLMERLVDLADSEEEWQQLTSAVNDYRSDLPAYRVYSLPLTVCAAELAERRREFEVAATLWTEVVETIDKSRAEDQELALLRRALTRLLDLHRTHAEIGNNDTVASLSLRLARLPGGSAQASQEFYALIVESWKWERVVEELAQDIHYPQAALRAWFEEVSEIARLRAFQWLIRHGNAWKGWVSEALEVVDQRVRWEVDHLIRLISLVSRRGDSGDAAARWEWVTLLAELLPEIERKAALRRSLSGRLQLHRAGAPLKDTRRIAEVCVRLIHLPDVPPSDVRIAYEELVRIWQWSEVDAELSAPECRYPEILLGEWIRSGRDKGEVVRWLIQHAEMLAEWSAESLTALEDELSFFFEDAPDTLLTFSRALARNPRHQSLSAWYLFRALCAGASLSNLQLQVLAARFPTLDPERCRTVLEKCSNAATLLDALLAAAASERVLLTWLSHLPAGALCGLSDDAFIGLLKAWVSDEISLEPALIKELAQRLNDERFLEAGSEYVEQIGGIQQKAWPLLKELATQDKPNVHAVEALFGPLFSGSAPPENLVAVLAELSEHGHLRQGNSRVGVCLDIWHTLGKSSNWPLLYQDRVESRILTSLAFKWLDYTDFPHRLDMLVVILEDVRQRANPNWLTPASLEFQALCAAGRFTEAEQLQSRYGDSLGRRGQSAQRSLDEARRQQAERTVRFESDLQSLWRLMRYRPQF